MKARNFRYIRPASLAHAYQILADTGGDAVPVAGGQSLLAGLNMRLSAPKLLVDIGDLKELAGQSQTGGGVRLGALTRHAELLRSDLVRKHLPLLSQAAPHIGHIAIRNRGTLGGSLAYADPAAELPACAVALGATLVLGSLAGEREVKAEDFFKGLFETDLRPGELIVAVKFPVTAAGTSTGFAELSRRHGDFALVGLAATVAMQHGRIDERQAGLFRLCRPRQGGASGFRRCCRSCSVPLRDSAAFDGAISQDLTPDDTPGLRADTKLHMAKVLTRRVLNSLSKRRRMTKLDLDRRRGSRDRSDLNGKPLKRRVKARQHLADFLRQELELTGTHLGCEHGICGACTVLVDGHTARGCLTLAAQISGKSVDTIEGLTESGKLAELQKRIHRAQRLAMRILLVGHAADRLRAHLQRRNAVACADPRSLVRQHVPLHRISRHHRRGRSGDRQDRRDQRGGRS